MQDCRSLNKDYQISPCRAGTPVLPAFFRPPQHSSPHKSCALREREAGIVLHSPHISKCLCHDAVVFLKINYSLTIHLQFLPFNSLSNDSDYSSSITLHTFMFWNIINKNNLRRVTTHYIFIYVFYKN